MNVTIGGIARTVEITSFDKLGDVKVCMLTTTADGSVGFQQLNQEVVDTIYASFPVDKASGDIASFEDGADNVPVRELKLNLEPYQNLNGYDHSWVGGAGVNKYNSKGLNTYANNGITVTESNGTLTLNGTATANAYFVLNGLTLPQGAYRFAIHNASANSNVHFSFQDSSSAYFGDNALDVASKIIAISNHSISTVVLYVANGTTLSNFTVKPQLESGTTATAWTPYENICPIYPSNGKNLFSGTLVNGQIGSNGGYSSSTSRLTNVTASNVLGDFLKAGTYTISAQAVTSATSLTQCTVLTKDSSLNIIDNFAASWHDLPFTFTLSSDGYICFTLRPSTGNVTPSNYVAQVEHGSIATIYVPYNAIGITRTGKNLWSLASGGTASTNFIIPKTSFPTVIPTGTYCLSFNATIQTAVQVTFKDSSDTTITSVVVNANQVVNGFFSTTVTLDRIACIASIYSNGTSTLSNIQVEKGSSASQYEPYTAERYYPISANPVYGGTLEVETGVLTVDRGYVVFDGTGWTMYTSGKFYSATDSLPQGNSGASVSNMFISNLYPFSGNGDSNSSAITTDKHFYAQKSYHRAWVYDSSFTTLESFQAELSANNLQIVYPLATPLVYQLTPVQVKTLLGYNNIWTDSGTVEVQYLANIGLYIQKIIGATEDDMVANQNISANKYFFVGETLYLSTSAISAGQTIVVGTNCIKTTLADALNALNS